VPARIALDAMGGDQAPHVPVEGAFLAAEDDFPIALVGDEGLVGEEIARREGLLPNLTVHHAREYVEMEDAPSQALRRKRDSSLRVCFELAKSDQIDAVVTMGHSGAALAMAMFVGRRLDGVLRPAIVATIPGRQRPVALLDVGGTIEARPEHLVQWAKLGTAYAVVALGVARPTVGLLANGTEDDKGTDISREAAAALRTLGPSFVGNVEPDGVLDGACDVVVCDGFAGNVLLKTAEATAKRLVTLVREAAAATPWSKAGAALMKPALRRAFSPLDPSEQGGALLLGVDPVTVIGHGSADPRAVRSALRLARTLVDGGLQDRLRAALAAG
jgi:glycerol-3-phosphate acyltransferase PlsX